MKTCPACNHQNPDDTRICKSCGYRLEISAGWEKTKIRGTHVEAFAPGYLVADRYEIVKEIGLGGMGVVYLVQDEWLESREVALKMIHPQLVELPEARQRFKQEVSTCLDLLHPNIVRVHNLEEWQGQQFFTMEYITGRSLQALIAERKSEKPPFTLSEAASIITPLLDALAYAHQYTIHRDIKPDNIIVMGDFPDVNIKVLDFGIAKTLSASRFTQTAQVLGTAFYMAPEQMSGGEIDHRADLYSTGMIFYELLTGEMAIGRFRLPGEIVAGLPKAIDEILEKALASRPEERFPDAEAMSRELKRVVSKSGPEIEAAPVVERPGAAAVADRGPQQIQEETSATTSVPAGTRRKLVPWVYACLVLLIVFLAAGVFFLSRDKKDSVTRVQPAQKEQILSKTVGDKEATGIKTIESEGITKKPPTQQTQLQKKPPEVTSETYIFYPNEKRVNNMKILAVTSWEGEAAYLIKGFQEKGIKIAKMPESQAPRALEVGIVDGVLTTSKELIFDLKKKFPKGVSLRLYPKISKMDQKPQVSKPDDRYVYISTEKAVLEYDMGTIVMDLNSPHKLKVLSKDANQRIWVEVVGWISEFRIIKSQEDVYVKNPQVATARLWETPEIGMESGAIGDVTDDALLIPVGEVRSLNKKDFVNYRKNAKWMGPPTKYIRVKIFGWISEEFITEREPDTKDLGEIHGIDLKKDRKFKARLEPIESNILQGQS